MRLYRAVDELTPFHPGDWLFAPLAFLGGAGPALLGTLLWGLGMGVHESIMAAAVGDYVGARKAAAAFGLVTFIFGFGQITGPAVAGVLAEKTGSFTSSFFMAACFAGLAILFAAFLKKPKTILLSGPEIPPAKIALNE